MSDVSHAQVRSLSSPSRKTQALVAAWHFLIAVAASAGLVAAWVEEQSSGGDHFFFDAAVAVVVPLVVLYLTTGWGILKWRKWGRTLALILNWINVLAGAVRLAHLTKSLIGVVSVLVSCLVLWWFNIPAVKLRFSGESGVR